jgi:hypothetical protein
MTCHDDTKRKVPDKLRVFVVQHVHVRLPIYKVLCARIGLFPLICISFMESHSIYFRV